MANRQTGLTLRSPLLWILCAGAGAIAAFLVPAGPVTRALAGWDVAIAAFVAFAIYTILNTDLEQLQQHAKDFDGGRTTILAVTIAAVAVCIGAIIGELAGGALKGENAGWLAIFIIGTILLSWTLVHLNFALHYAHEYYQPDNGEPAQGLKFPGDAEPIYGDFVHFSYVIGCAMQTADIEIVSPDLRRVTTVQTIVSYVFNTAIVALVINIGASVLSGN